MTPGAPCAVTPTEPKHGERAGEVGIAIFSCGKAETAESNSFCFPGLMGVLIGVILFHAPGLGRFKGNTFT